MAAPLDDITVVEIDNWMASPSAGAILADMGATVIKVEPLTGDPMRDMSRPPKFKEPNEALQDYDFQFDVDNRGKRSIAVALDTPEGAAVVHKLVAGAQIFMCNLLTRRQEKFGLDPQSLLKINPSLVHATLTGYGTDGPEAWRPGYDVTAFFGRSGLYDAMREGDDGIVPMARPAQGDHTTGLAFLGGILGALRLAERSGEGQVIETSLYEAAVWTQATDYCVTAQDAAPVRRRRRQQQLSITANRFPCGDGKWVVLNMPEQSAWPKFCKALGREDLIDIERFKDGSNRYRNMEELLDIIDETLQAKGRDEWGALFDEAKVIWGPVLCLHEVATDGQAEAIGLFPEVIHPQRGAYKTVNAPMRFHTADVGPKGPSPVVGEHTRELLTQAGFAGEDIDQLLASNIVRANDDG